MLTATQKVDVRRFAGYPLGGVADSTHDQVPIQTRGVITTLDSWLDNLSTAEETVLINTYLDRLGDLEMQILNALDNIDTSEAGPWKANPREQSDRERLFDSWRRRMCGFIGLQPGPDLGSGGLTIIRA